MDEKQVCKELRREFSRPGWVLLIYYAIMNVAVTLACIADSVITVLRTGADSVDAMIGIVMDSLLGNGWGYILAMAVGALLMLKWKKRDFCFRVIWQTKKPMTAASFWILLCVFLSGQAVFQVLAALLSLLFGLFGISLEASIEMAGGLGDTFSMFLYAGLFAPIGEEILFRGLILRSLQPYGKKFAILASAFLFGVFHGNVVQSPYAFAVGLVLGYVTLEYSIGWAMVLHMINNLVLGDLLERLTRAWLSGMYELVTTAIILVCTVIAFIVLIVKRREVRAYRKDGRMHPWCLKSFFTAPGVLVLTILLMGSALLTLFLQ